MNKEDYTSKLRDTVINSLEQARNKMDEERNPAGYIELASMAGGLLQANGDSKFPMGFQPQIVEEESEDE